MADDIKVVADYTDLQLMRRELVGVGKDAQKSASVFETQFRKVEASMTKAAKEAQTYYKSIYEADLANKNAYKSAKFLEAELSRQDATIERLSKKYKPLYAASKQYETALEEINQAHKLSVLSSNEHSLAVDRLNKEYLDFQNGTAGWSNQFVTGASRAGKSVNRFGMYAQQVGYQVGDFFVQIQGGTNAFVAFGQQATQLAGLLPGLAGAIVGIGISVSTMFLSMWSRSKQASEGIDQLTSKMKEFSDKGRDAKDTIEAFNLGLKDTSELGFVRSIQEAEAAVARMENNYKQVSQFGDARTFAAEKELKAAKENLKTLQDEYKLAQDRVAQEERLLSIREAASQAAKDYIARVQLERQQTSELEKQVTLQQKILQFGENSNAVFQLRKQYALEEYETTLKDANVKGDTLRTLLQMKSASLDNERAIAASSNATSVWEDRMRGVKYEINAILSSLSAIGGGVISNAAKQAEIDALKAGKSIKEAAVAQETFRKNLEWDAREASANAEGGIFGWIKGQAIESEKVIYQEGLALDRVLDKQRELAREREKAAKKKGGSKTAIGDELTWDKRLTSFQGILAQQDDPDGDPFAKQQEQLDIWRKKAEESLLAAQLKEQGMLQEHKNYMLEIEQRYQHAKQQIQNEEKFASLSAYGDMFGALATVAEAGGKKMLRTQATLSAAATMIAAYETASKAAAEATTIPGRIAAWSLFVGKGVAAVNSIKQAASAAGASSGGSTASSASTSSSSSTTTTTTDTSTPQRIILDIPDNARMTKEQLSELFDNLYDENKDRGFIFSVG